MPDHAPAPTGRRIALIAHDNKKQDMIEWAEYNLDLLAAAMHPAPPRLTSQRAQITNSCAVLPAMSACRDLRHIGGYGSWL